MSVRNSAPYSARPDARSLCHFAIDVGLPQRQEVEAVLHKAQLSIDDVRAKTLERKLVSFERLDRMLASAEARRNNALREIDRHRSAFGAAVRQAIDEAEDVEFRDVETGEVIAEG